MEHLGMMGTEGLCNMGAAGCMGEHIGELVFFLLMSASSLDCHIAESTSIWTGGMWLAGDMSSLRNGELTPGLLTPLFDAD